MDAPEAPHEGVALYQGAPLWRDTMRPVRIYGFDARVLAVAGLWVLWPGWWTSALLVAGVIGFRIAEIRGYRLPAAVRAVRAWSARGRPALYGSRSRHFVDFG